MASAIRKALGPIVKRLSDAHTEVKRLLDLPPDQQTANIQLLRVIKEKLLKYSDTYQRKYSEWLSLADEVAGEMAKIDEDLPHHSNLTVNTDDAVALLNSTIAEIERQQESVRAQAELNRRDQLWAQAAPVPLARPAVTVKLPKLELEKFDGEIINWPSFWDRFQISVHQNTSISDVDKFNYLKAHLTGRAHRAIAGLAVTAANYPGAIDILKKRFGAKNAVVNAHYTALANLAPATGNNHKLRDTVDKIEQYLNALEALEEDVENRLLLTTVKSKIPIGVIIRLQELHGEEFTDVTSLREALQRYLSNREEAEMGRNSPTWERSVRPSGQQHRAQPVSISTTSSLLSSRTTPNKKCAFCLKTSHWTDECRAFPTAESRQQKIGANCQKCLRPGHRISECRRTKPCFHCRNPDHHSSLCPQKFPSVSTVSTVLSNATDEPVAAVQESNTHHTSSLLASGESVLLQTATTDVQSPGGKNSIQTRLLFDSCSHRTYITEKLAKELQLPSLGKEYLSVGTFGLSTHKKIQSKVVELQLKLKDSSFITVRANVIPVITGDIQRTPINFDKYKALYGNLPFADVIPTEQETLRPDFLIGNDYYWEIVTAERIILDKGLFLIGSKLGWILTGRHQSSPKSTLPPWVTCSSTLTACCMGYEMTFSDSSDSSESEPETTHPAPPIPKLSMLNQVDTEDSVLPQTAVIICQSPSGDRIQPIRVIFDTGCTTSFLTTEIASLLRLPIIDQSSNNVVSFGSEHARSVSSDIVQLQLQQLDGRNFPMEVHTIQTIASPFPLPGCDLETLLKQSPRPFNGPLANSVSSQSQTISVDLVIGCDYYWDLINTNRIDLPCGLRLISSKFGWIACGRFRPTSAHTHLNLLAVNVGTNSPPLSGSENLIIDPQSLAPDNGAARPSPVSAPLPKSSLIKSPLRQQRLRPFVLSRFSILLFLTVFVGSMATGYTLTPLLCEAEEAKVVLDLSIKTECPKDHDAAHEIRYGTVTIFKRNIAKYTSRAYRCKKIKTVYSAWTNFAKAGWDHHLDTIDLALPAEECLNMVKLHRCSEGPLLGSDILAYTENKAAYPYTTGNAWDCCEWRKAEATNCFLTKGKVYKTFSGTMESNLGNVADCDYDKGSCGLQDKSTLVWETAKEVNCEFVEWKKFPGQYWNGHFLSDDREIALTWKESQEATIDLCNGAKGKMTDQGIPILAWFGPVTHPHRSKRFLLKAELDREHGRLKKEEQTDLVAARLQALEERLDELMMDGLNAAFGHVCRAIQKMQQIDLLLAHSEPTLIARHILNDNQIMARLNGKLLEVWPCIAVESYSIKPMGTRCTEWIPLNITAKGKSIPGYLDPKTNIVFQNSAPAKCKLVHEIHLHDHDGSLLIYSANEGTVKSFKGAAPQHPLYHDNLSVFADFKKVIHKGLAMYSVDEIRAQTSLNDIYESLDQNRRTLDKLADLGNEQPPDPQASNIMDNLNRYTPWGMISTFCAKIADAWVYLCCTFVTCQVVWALIGRRLILKLLKSILPRRAATIEVQPTHTPPRVDSSNTPSPLFEQNFAPPAVFRD